MNKLLMFLALTVLSVGAFAGDYTSSFSTITTNSNMITNVTGTVDMNEDWNGSTTLRTTSAVLQPLEDEFGNAIDDPNNPGTQLIGLVTTTFTRSENNLVGKNSITDGDFEYQSTAIGSGLGHKVESNGVGAGGGFRTTEIKTSSHAGETVLVTTVKGDATQTDTAGVYVDFDPLTGNYDSVYDTEVGYSTKTITITDFNRDVDTTYSVNAASNSTTVIDQWYSTAYNNVYN